MPWAFTTLNFESLWTNGLTGKGINVCHLDTGVDGTHPFVKARLSQFVKIDSGGTAEPQQGIDSDGHDTHTADLCA
jgi:subtilisin family serine protease